MVARSLFEYSHLSHNMCLMEKCLPQFNLCVLGATLIALKKKEGGLRPIAVGQTLRRMVAKCAAHLVIHTIGADLAHQQLGCGIPLGCEAAVHTARLYVHNLPFDHLLLKLDFKNAFICLHRDKMLSAVSVSAPMLLKFVYSAYSVPSQLYCPVCGRSAARTSPGSTTVLFNNSTIGFETKV